MSRVKEGVMMEGRDGRKRWGGRVGEGREREERVGEGKIGEEKKGSVGM